MNKPTMHRKLFTLLLVVSVGILLIIRPLVFSLANSLFGEDRVTIANRTVTVPFGWTASRLSLPRKTIPNRTIHVDAVRLLEVPITIYGIQRSSIVVTGFPTDGIAEERLKEIMVAAGEKVGYPPTSTRAVEYSAVHAFCLESRKPESDRVRSFCVDHGNEVAYEFLGQVEKLDAFYQILSQVR